MEPDELWLGLGEYHGPGHFRALLGYCVSRVKRSQRTEAFRSYVADSLQGIPQGSYLRDRYSDVVDRLRRGVQEIDVDAIIDHVVSIASVGD